MLQVGASAGLIAAYFQDKDSVADSLEAHYGISGQTELFLALFILALALSAPVLILNTNLIGLHALLGYRGITTYEYILSKRKNRVNVVLEAATIITNKPITDTAIETTNFDLTKVRSTSPDILKDNEFTSSQNSDRI